MTATLLDGRAIAQCVLQNVAERAAALRARGIEPCLAFLMLGSSPPAEMYANRLEKLAHRVHIHMARHRLSDTTSLAELDQEAARLNADPLVDGILVQMPLPDHLSPADLSVIIDARKDVDGISIQNAGRLYLGLPGPAPSTASAMMQILDSENIDPFGRHVVVVGRSNVVGHPVAELVLQRDATVTVTHRQTADLGALTRLADVLIVAAGEPKLIAADMVKPGVVIIDAGINVTDHGVVGDVDFEACREIASYITPVPGGVGPVTNAVLLRHVVESAEQRER